MFAQALQPLDQSLALYRRTPPNFWELHLSAADPDLRQLRRHPQDALPAGVRSVVRSSSTSACSNLRLRLRQAGQLSLDLPLPRHRRARTQPDRRAGPCRHASRQSRGPTYRSPTSRIIWIAQRSSAIDSADSAWLNWRNSTASPGPRSPASSKTLYRKGVFLSPLQLNENRQPETAA